MISNIEDFDLIISHPFEKNNARPLHRKVASAIFTQTVNLIFGYKLKYYNGIPVIKKSVMDQINIKSKSPFFMAEIVLKILKLNLRYDQRIVFFTERQYGKSSVFNLKTIIRTVIDLIYIRVKF